MQQSQINQTSPHSGSAQYSPQQQPGVGSPTMIHHDGQGHPLGKILNERIIEKSMTIPRRIIREEIVEDSFFYTERIIEVAKPIQQEKIIEVPEIEYRDKIREVVEKVYEEKIKEVPKIEYCERIIEVPKYITQEKIVEVPVIEYKDVVTEKVVEIPEYHQNLIIKEVPVPSYIDETGQPVEQPVVKIERKIPVPVEAVTTYEYQIAQFRPRVTKVQYPMYVPRFIPVPVPAEQIEATKLESMQNLANSLSKLVGPQAVGLHEIEELHKQVDAHDYASQLPTPAEAQQIIREKWLTGQLQVTAGEIKQ